MPKTILQVRDIEVEILDALKARARSQGMSLSAFVRNLLTYEVSAPSPDEVMDRIASREPIAASSDQIRELIDEGRRW